MSAPRAVRRVSRPDRRSRRSARPGHVTRLERLLTETDAAVRRHLHAVRNGHPVQVEAATEAEERIQADPVRELELQLLEEEARTGARIREAIDRADRGEGEECVRCGRRIGKARQRALPFTDTCRECQEKEEASNSRRTPMVSPWA